MLGSLLLIHTYRSLTTLRNTLLLLAQLFSIMLTEICSVRMSILAHIMLVPHIYSNIALMLN